jgi:hypothetical protein
LRKRVVGMLKSSNPNQFVAHYGAGAITIRKGFKQTLKRILASKITRFEARSLQRKLARILRCRIMCAALGGQNT